MATLIRQAAMLPELEDRTDGPEIQQRRRDQEALLAFLREDPEPDATARSEAGPPAPAAAQVQELLHNHRLLRLAPRDRQRCVDTWEREAARIENGFAPALASLLPGEAAAGLRERIARRWLQAPDVAALYIPQRGPRTPAAFYVPAIRTIFVNLNAAVERPELLADSFAHELWHHLLPTVTPANVAANLWWEGFNEAISEWWTANLPGGSPPGGKGPVIYPTVTAVASLFLVCDRSLTARWLTGEIGQDAFLEELGRAGFPALPELPPRMAETFAGAEEICGPRAERLRRLLTDWGQDAPAAQSQTLDDLLRPGRLDRTAFNRLYAENRQAAFAFIDAVAVVFLQDLLAVLPRRRLLQAGRASLPAALAENLIRSLNHARSPEMPLH